MVTFTVRIFTNCNYLTKAMSRSNNLARFLAVIMIKDGKL